MIDLDTIQVYHRFPIKLLMMAKVKVSLPVFEAGYKFLCNELSAEILQMIPYYGHEDIDYLIVASHELEQIYLAYRLRCTQVVVSKELEEVIDE